MPKNMTVYNLLISCPSDVNGYVQMIEKIISDFNSMYGEINNSLIVPKHWKKDSFAESGGKPQDLLNEQFVLDSDVAVALFWTKFGTPTENFNSGTEEEIELLLEQKKQVFMYFLNAPISPSELDQEQYQKVKDFQKKYADKGIYSVIHDEDEFKRKFTNDLARYFMPLIMDDDIKNNNSNLLIENGYLKDTNMLVEHSNLSNTKLIEDKFKNCEEVIEKINEIYLERNSISNFENASSNSRSVMESILESKPVIVSDEVKDIVQSFFENNKKEMKSTFFEVGGLTERINVASLAVIGGSKYSYDGTKEEIKKYELINQLYWKVKEYNEYVSFFERVDNYSYISCTLVNDGNSFDEDIDVKLYFPKDTVMSPSKFPIPEENIIEELQDEYFLEFLLHLNGDDTTTEYDNYPVATPRYLPQNFGPFTSRKGYDDFKREYMNEIERIMCFEVFEKEEHDVFRFKVNYLKQHTKMLFPSKIFLNNDDVKIRYEISSKYSPEVIEGNIAIE